MHLVNAPQAGTGKSFLLDLAALIATGERCAVMSVSPKPEETEKRLIAAALSGFPIIAIDNCREPLQGDFLCQVTERPLLQLRPLGTSTQTRIPNTFTTFANGNNAIVADDLVRRTLRCDLDANLEKPEERQFKSNPKAMILADRGSYIAACLTIPRAYVVAGRPHRLTPLPSYEPWSDNVRSPLVWLGCPDPVDTIASARADDPVRQARTSVFTAWATELGLDETGYFTSELVNRAEERHPEDGPYMRPELRNSFLSVARQRKADHSEIDRTQLGKWLHASANTIAQGYKLTVDRTNVARPRWILTQVG
jgi:putative DNA primase/helicase